MVFVFCIAINFVVQGALNSVSSLANKLAYGFTQSAYWIIAAPVVLIGVFVYDETLKMLWVCLAVFSMLICPIAFILLRQIDFVQVVQERKKIDNDRNTIELRDNKMYSVFDE